MEVLYNENDPFCQINKIMYKYAISGSKTELWCDANIEQRIQSIICWLPHFF